MAFKIYNNSIKTEKCMCVNFNSFGICVYLYIVEMNFTLEKLLEVLKFDTTFQK